MLGRRGAGEHAGGRGAGGVWPCRCPIKLPPGLVRSRISVSCIGLGGLTAIAGGVRAAKGAGVVCSRMGVKKLRHAFCCFFDMERKIDLSGDHTADVACDSFFGRDELLVCRQMVGMVAFSDNPSVSSFSQREPRPKVRHIATEWW